MSKQEEDKVRILPDHNWLQLGVGLCITLVFGLVAYIVSQLNSQVGNAISVLQESDRVLVLRVTELEKQSSYTLARREMNNRRFEQIEATVKQQWTEINALKTRR